MASAGRKGKFGASRKPADPTKKLVIETKTVQRLVTELRNYFKEVDENRAKIEKMRMEGADEYDIKKFGEVLDESEMMVPDSQRRLKQYTRKLRETVEDLEDKPGVSGTEALKNAQAILAEVAAGIKPEAGAAPAAASRPAPAGAAGGGGGAGGSDDAAAASPAKPDDPATGTGAAAPAASAPSGDAPEDEEICEEDM